MSENVSENQNRLGSYKNFSKNSQEMRQRRQEISVELRKSKKDDQMLKRRNIEINEPTSPLQESNGQTPVPAQMSLEEIHTSILSGKPVLEYMAVQAIRKMLSREKNPPIDSVISMGLVPNLIQYLENFDNSAIQFEAAWALTNIASGSSAQTNAVIDAGAVSRFVELLGSPAANVAEQAVWALGNVAGDGPEARDIVLNHNVVEYLLKLISADNVEISFLRNIVWLMSNLCRNKNPTPPFDKIRQLLPALSSLLNHPDRMVLSDVCWALSYVTDDCASKIQAVVDAGCVPRLVSLLECDDPAIVTPTLRSVGNIVTGDDRQTDAVLANNSMPKLIKLLQHKKSNIVKEAAWTVSNITAGNQMQIQRVIDDGALGPLVNVLESGDFKAQREAVWAITNITSGGSDEQIIHMIEKYPVIKPFCELLTSNDARTVAVILSGLQGLFRTAESVNGVTNFCLMLEEIGAVDKLESLQNHENEEIYAKAFAMIDTYFSENEDSDTKEIAPKEVDGALEFNPSPQNNGGDGGQFSF